MRAYGKVIVAILAAAAMALYQFLDDGHITPVEWVTIAITTTIAVNTYLVPLTVEWPWMKTAVAVVISVLNVLVIVILDGITQQEIIELLIAVLTPLGIGVAPAISHNGVAANP